MPYILLPRERIQVNVVVAERGRGGDLLVWNIEFRVEVDTQIRSVQKVYSSTFSALFGILIILYYVLYSKYTK